MFHSVLGTYGTKESRHFHRKNTGGGDPAFQRQPNSQFAYISPLYKFVGLFTAICLGYIFMVTYLFAASCMCGDRWFLDCS
jgi:hypothetical protein